MAGFGVGARRAALGAALYALGATVAAPGATLQRLTVDSFTLSADTASPALEVPFHLVVSVHVRQRVNEIDNLELPILAELELQGDERRVQSDAGGTQYRETITVVAHHTGTIDIAPATLQAIDARDGKPKQYFSNKLTVNVSGGALAPAAAGERFAAAALGLALRAVLWTAGLACALVLLVLFFRRRPRPQTPPPPPAAPAPIVPRARSVREELQDALTVLRAERTRAAAVRVRAAVWRMTGAAEGETLEDVLQRPAAREGRMRDLLRALERAAFTYDADLGAALDAAVANLERALA